MNSDTQNTHETSAGFTTTGREEGTLTVSPNLTVTNNDVFYFYFDTGDTFDRCYGIIVTYDHP